MELPNARHLFPEVRQRADEWCIPAGLEVLLHYFGISKPTQEDMVLRFDEMFGQHGYIIQGKPAKFLTKPTITHLALCGFPAPHGNFDGFTTVANSLLPADCSWIFRHPNDCDNEFENHLAGALRNGDGILGVIRLNNGNCHVLPIIGYDGSDVTVYDPGPGTIETKAIGGFTFNRDCVLLTNK
jgi:hypothetical protein